VRIQFFNIQNVGLGVNGFTCPVSKFKLFSLTLIKWLLSALGLHRATDIVLSQGPRSHRPRYCVTTPVHIDLWSWPMTLTFNLRRAIVMIHRHTQKFKFKDQSVQMIELKQKDGQTDGQTYAIDCFTFPSNEVGKNMKLLVFLKTLDHEFSICKKSAGFSREAAVMRRCERVRQRDNGWLTESISSHQKPRSNFLHELSRQRSVALSGTHAIPDYWREWDCIKTTHYFFVTDRVSREAKAIGIGSIRLSVPLFPLYLLKRLTFELAFLCICES